MGVASIGRRLEAATDMNDKITRIHNAVRQCVRECHLSPTPFFAIGRYCDRLRAAGDWQPNEVDQIESAAWREMQSLHGQFGHDR